jgi:hypothetical protein
MTAATVIREEFSLLLEPCPTGGLTGSCSITPTVICLVSSGCVVPAALLGCLHTSVHVTDLAARRVFMHLLAGHY